MAETRPEGAEGGARLEVAAQADDGVQAAVMPSVTSWGPEAEPSAPATDGRPVTIRLCPPFQILVIAPEAPMQTSPSPSGEGTHAPVPPRPASAT